MLFVMELVFTSVSVFVLRLQVMCERLLQFRNDSSTSMSVNNRVWFCFQGRFEGSSFSVLQCYCFLFFHVVSHSVL